MEIHQLHPIIVHFVIAPLFIAVVFDFLWLITKQHNFEKFSWYSLIIAASSGILSVVTGLMAEENVVFPESSIEVFNSHELLAFILIIFALLAIFLSQSKTGYLATVLILLYLIVMKRYLHSSLLEII